MRIRAGELEGSTGIKEELTDVFKNLLKERTIFLAQEITTDLASYIVANLFLLDQKDPQKEIIMYINSTGGTVPDGLFTIYDCMQCISAPIKTICIGEAYSSAAVILSAGTKGRRFASAHSKIMIHGLQIQELSGTMAEIEKEAKLTKDMNRKMMDILALHTGQSLKKVKRDCLKDKYFDPKDAVAYGLIDDIFQPIKITGLK